MQENDNRIPTNIEELLSSTSFFNYCFELNEEDVSYWNSLLQHHPTQRPLVEEAKNILLLLKDTPSDHEIEYERTRLLKKLGLTQDRTVLNIKQKKGYKWLATAAALLLVGFGALYFVQQEDDRIPAKEEITLLRQTTPAGKIMHIQLTDGTLVDLAAGSTLIYPSHFSDSIRTVQLEGDAQFKVTHIEAKPFIVKTTDLDVKVLGTTFNVQAFPTDRNVRIALFEGSVQVNRNKEAFMLTPDHVLIYDKQTGVFESATFDQEEEQERVNGLLVFDNASYEELGQRLAHKYGITFIPDESINIAFSGKIWNESIEEVLKKLNFTTAYQFAIESNTLIVKHK